MQSAECKVQKAECRVQSAELRVQSQKAVKSAELRPRKFHGAAGLSFREIR